MRQGKEILILVLFVIMAASATTASAASLWLNGNDLYSSNGGARNYMPGDIVTINITEESNATSKASTSTSKEATVEGKSGPQIPLIKNVVSKVVGKAEVGSEFDGKGTTSRSGKLTGTITATVVEVLGNGNLLLEGSRSILVNQENQLMRVRGIARPKDINVNNTISSKMLADAKITFDGRGAVNTPNKKGVLTKFFDAIF